MPFWLHEPKYVRFIKGTPLEYKIFGTVIIAAFLGLYWILFLFIPTQHAIKHKQQEYTVLCDQKALFEKTLSRYDYVIDDHTRLFKVFEQLSMSSTSLQKTLNVLVQLMHSYDLSCRGIQYKKHVVKDFYEKRHVLLVGKGDFKKIIGFLAAIKEIRKPIKFKSFVLEKGKQGMLKFQALVRIINLKEV